MAALTEFGFGSIGLTEEAFVTPDTIVQLGYPPRRIDILTEPSGVEFEECSSRKFEVTIDGTTVPFIGLEDLKRNKLASGRPRDLADIDDLS